MQANNVVKKILVAGSGVVAAAAGASANAAVDMSSITGAVSAGDVVTGILAIGAIMAVVWMTVKAVKVVMAFLKSA